MNTRFTSSSTLCRADFHAIFTASRLGSRRYGSGLVFTLLAILFFTTSGASALPKIKILATGGTIAGAQTTQADAGYKSGTFSVEDLIKAVPQLKNIALMSGEQVANIGSQTMNHEVWLKLAKRVNEVLNSDETDGVVIARHRHDGRDGVFSKPPNEKR